MAVVFDGEIHVHYRFLHLAVRGADLVAQASQGQTNGLCGAQPEGQLSFLTGLHTGPVRFAIEWFEAEPAWDDAWDEAVEVSFDVPQSDMVLTAFDDWADVELPATGAHRARFCAADMDEANELDTATSGPGPDRYLLQLWPAPPRPDAIIRQKSVMADLCHRHAQGLR